MCLLEFDLAAFFDFLFEFSELFEYVKLRGGADAPMLQSHFHLHLELVDGLVLGFEYDPFDIGSRPAVGMSLPVVVFVKHRPVA